MQAGQPINFTTATSANRKIVNLETIETSGSGLTIGSQSLNLNSTLDATFTGPKLVINADVDIQGTLNSVSSTEVTFDDSTILLNSNKTGAAANGDPDAGFEVNRGANTNVSFLWNETNDNWTLTGGKFVQLGNATFDNGTNTTIDVLSDNTGMSWLRLIGNDQGTGAVEVGQSSLHGGGMAYNGDNNPAFVTGETADNICFYRNDGGTRHEVFHYRYNSDVVNFNATPTVAGNPVWHAGNDGAGSTLDADLLDGLQATQFLRSDTSDVVTAGSLTVGDGTRAETKLIIKASNDGVSDHIQFYNGTTRIGEIGCKDSWLRINQETAQNIYTPRMIRADGGFQVDSKQVVSADGNTLYENNVALSDKYLGKTAKAADSDKLDGLQASNFLRADTADTLGGRLTVTPAGGLNFQLSTAFADSATTEQHDFMKFGTHGSLSQISKRGALMLTSSDDSLVLAAGDVGRSFNNTHLDADGEGIYLINDGDIFFKTNLQDGWTSGNVWTYTFGGGQANVNGPTGQKRFWHEGNLPVTVAKDGNGDTVYTFDALP